MDPFIVSARKYRPQNFSTVIGQAHITTTLKNAILHNQLAHAYLFCGPRGVGKTTCARILAKSINCEQLQPDGEACNACPSCESFNNGTSLNIHELDAASNNSVDDIRSLTEQIRFAPQAGRYKVYIIDEVHMLSQAAFNAFLKTLEEPPSYAIFILATTEKHRILPTILSRCQIFDFKRITTTDTVTHLDEIVGKEGIRAEKAALQLIAQKSEGCLRDALSILDKIVSFTNGELSYAETLEHLNILDEDYFFKLLDLLTGQDLPGALLLYDEINAKGFEGEEVLTGFAEFLRNLMVCKDERTVPLLQVVDSFRPRYAASAGSLPFAWLVSALHILGEAEQAYRQTRNRKLHMELCLIKLTYLKQALELTEDGGRLQVDSAVDKARPVRFRKLRPVAVPGTKRPVEKESETRSNRIEPVLGEVAGQKAEGTKTQKAAPVTKGLMAEAREEKKETLSLGTLQKIRQQIARQQTDRAELKELNDEHLKAAWEAYTLKLTDAKNHSTATNFKLATLRITGEHSFDIIAETNIQQRFIEQERGPLIDHLQQFFKNRLITYQVLVEPGNPQQEPVEKPLSTREQYLKLAEQYPLVKELKERLNLELDY